MGLQWNQDNSRQEDYRGALGQMSLARRGTMQYKCNYA